MTQMLKACFFEGFILFILFIPVRAFFVSNGAEQLPHDFVVKMKDADFDEKQAEFPEVRVWVIW